MRWTFAAILIFMMGSCVEKNKSIKPPVAEKIPVDVGMHGDKRIDNYYWMNDYFKKGPLSDKVLKHLQLENVYTESVLSNIRGLRDTLFTEMKSRIKEKDETVPVLENGYYYYSRYEEGKQYAVYCRKKGNLAATEEILLNVNEMAAGHPYFKATGFTVSPDNQLLAYAVDTLSRRQYSIYIKNLSSGEIYTDVMYPAADDLAWANDSKTLFYIENNPQTLLTEKIKKHVLGTNVSDDKVVYLEKDNSNYLNLSKLRSKKYIVVTSSATMSSEVMFVDAARPDEDLKVIQSRMKDVLYSVDEQNGKFLIRTNYQAKNFRLMETPVGNPSVDNWKDIIPHRKDVLIENVHAFNDFYVVTERKDGLIQFRVHQNNNLEDHYVAFDEPAYSAEIGSNAEFDTSVVRFEYTSLITPESEFDYDMVNRKKIAKQKLI